MSELGIENLMEKIKPVKTAKQEFENRDELIRRALSEVLDYQDSDARVSIGDFSMKSSFTDIQFSLDTLREEIKPVVTEIHEFEY